MLNLDVSKWIKHTAKYHGKGKSKGKAHKDHPQIVAIRISRPGNAVVFRFLIGSEVADIMDFKKGDRLGIFIHKQNKNLILITKTNDNKRDYILSRSESSNFYTIEIRPKNIDTNQFHEQSTQQVNFDITQNKILLIDLSNVKRSS